jgi:hypothetical protein
VLRLFHVDEKGGEVRDASAIGVAKFDAARGDERLSHTIGPLAQKNGLPNSSRPQFFIDEAISSKSLHRRRCR